VFRGPRHPDVPLITKNLNRIDLRAAKHVRVGRFRTMVSFDLYNVLNSNWPTPSRRPSRRRRRHSDCDHQRAAVAVLQDRAQ
jgi:hypothetical protein